MNVLRHAKLILSIEKWLKHKRNLHNVNENLETCEGHTAIAWKQSFNVSNGFGKYIIRIQS